MWSLTAKKVVFEKELELSTRIIGPERFLISTLLLQDKYVFLFECGLRKLEDFNFSVFSHSVRARVVDVVSFCFCFCHELVPGDGLEHVVKIVVCVAATIVTRRSVVVVSCPCVNYAI